jgi:hypothetical protein
LNLFADFKELVTGYCWDLGGGNDPIDMVRYGRYG